MTIFAQYISVAPVGIFFRKTGPMAFEACLYRLHDFDRSSYYSGDGEHISPLFDETSVVLSQPITVNLQDLSKREDWSDYGCFVVPFDLGGGFLRWKPPFNIFQETFVSKASSGRNATRNEENYGIVIFVPHKGVSSLDECGISIVGHKGGDLPIITDRWPVFEGDKIVGTQAVANPPTPIVIPEGSYISPEVFLRMQVFGPSQIPADAYGTFQVGVTYPNGDPVDLDGFECRIETTGGYLPLQRVTIQNGMASFRVGALGLLPGDSFKIKVGSKFFTGIKDAIVGVI